MVEPSSGGRVTVAQRALDTVRSSVGRVANRLVTVSPDDTPLARAERLGYVVHGEFGLKIAYDPDVISEQVLTTIERGGYERFEARRTGALIEDGDRVLELGAGLGFLSALVLSTRDVADYQLVEADPRLPALIRRTHELNALEGRPVGVHTCVATCDQKMITAGTVEFFVSNKFCASSLLGSGNMKHTVDIPVVPLTQLLEQHRSNVLICDIEGAEMEVFDGTPLDGVEKVLTEIHPHRIGRGGVREVFRNLDRIGFVYDTELSAGAVCGFRRYEEGN